MVPEILRRSEKCMLRAMCGVQLKERKRSTDLMFMMTLSEAIDQWLWQTMFIGIIMC